MKGLKTFRLVGLGLWLGLWLAMAMFVTMGCHREDSAREADQKQRAETKRIVDRMFKGSDTAIRKYTRQQRQQPPRKDRSQ